MTQPVRWVMLHVRAECLIVNACGEIVDYELNRPFTYLHQTTEGQNPRKIMSSGSDQIRLGAHASGASQSRRSSVPGTPHHHGTAGLMVRR
jgi:hypothetical protein